MAEPENNLLGEAGQDKYVFNTGRAFAAADMDVDSLSFGKAAEDTDKIILDKTTFTALKSTFGIGFSKSSEFATVTSDSAAATSNALIVYNKSNGHLFYNQNGAAAGLGTGAQFATLDNKIGLVATDFVLSSNSNLLTFQQHFPACKR